MINAAQPQKKIITEQEQLEYMNKGEIQLLLVHA
jgi:hypothetical protein